MKTKSEMREMPTIERRYISAEDLRIVRAKHDDPPRLVGHAAVFNELSEPMMWGWRERIIPGAFAHLLNTDVRSLWNHDPNFVLGRTIAKTLTLGEDNRGLTIDNPLPQTDLVRDMVLAPIERRDVTQMSFAFSMGANSKQVWIEDDEEEIREIHKFGKLWDVSPVTYAAYAGTDVDARAALASLEPVLARSLRRAERGKDIIPADAGALREAVLKLAGYLTEKGKRHLCGHLVKTPAETACTEDECRVTDEDPAAGVTGPGLEILRRRLDVAEAMNE